MTQLIMQLTEADYQRLEHAAEQASKSVQAFIADWIAQLPKGEQDFDVTQDPIFQLEGYESEAPADPSVTIDQYLYQAELS